MRILIDIETHSDLFNFAPSESKFWMQETKNYMAELLQPILNIIENEETKNELAIIIIRFAPNPLEPGISIHGYSVDTDKEIRRLGSKFDTGELFRRINLLIQQELN